MMMKRIASLLLITLLLRSAVACAQGTVAATLVGNAIVGTYTSPEVTESAGIVVTSDTAAARIELLGWAALTGVTAETGVPFIVDLCAAGGPVRITDRQTGSVTTAEGLTPALLAQFVAGDIRVSVYRGDAYAPAALLAEGALAPAAMAVTSAGIQNGVLADAYGRRGTQKHKGVPSLSMPLHITGIPAGTVALAVSMVDPDGGDWVHWLAANIPVMADIPANASIDLAGQMVQGKNSFGFTGYGGPTPPSGTHGYVITVYALAAPLPLKDGFKQKALDKALAGTVLAQAQVTGAYSR